MTVRIWLNHEKYYVVVDRRGVKPISRGFDTRIEAEIEMERIVKLTGASKC